MIIVFQYGKAVNANIKYCFYCVAFFSSDWEDFSFFIANRISKTSKRSFVFSSSVNKEFSPFILKLLL